MNCKHFIYGCYYSILHEKRSYFIVSFTCFVSLISATPVNLWEIFAQITFDSMLVEKPWRVWGKSFQHDDVIKWKIIPRYWPQMLVTRSFDVFFDLRLNKRLSKQSWGWWFETPSRPLWRHDNETRLLHNYKKGIPYAELFGCSRLYPLHILFIYKGSCKWMQNF